LHACSLFLSVQPFLAAPCCCAAGRCGAEAHACTVRVAFEPFNHVLPQFAAGLQGVAELKRELSERAVLTEMPEIHQFLDGFYLSRIGIRILIGEAACGVMLLLVHAL
jgi:hypothetical protein